MFILVLINLIKILKKECETSSLPLNQLKTYLRVFLWRQIQSVFVCLLWFSYICQQKLLLHCYVTSVFLDKRKWSHCYSTILLQKILNSQSKFVNSYNREGLRINQSFLNDTFLESGLDFTAHVAAFIFYRSSCQELKLIVYLF